MKQTGAPSYEASGLGRGEDTTIQQAQCTDRPMGDDGCKKPLGQSRVGAGCQEREGRKHKTFEWKETKF